MFIVCATVLFACIIGKICGMGGGVIIKPVLDAMGIMGVSAINLASGCTVLGMSMWSVGKSVYNKEKGLDFKVSTPLAIGAAIGGILGKLAYSAVAGCFANADTAGGVQAILLGAATAATLIYSINKARVKSYHVSNFFVCTFIGLILGMAGAFLGIGGGPFNVAVLYLFFSMTTKAAALNSLYIIFISQAAGLLLIVAKGEIPDVDLVTLLLMVLFGIIGSEVGRRIGKKLSEEQTSILFDCSMVLVIGICIFNVIRFFG